MAAAVMSIDKQKARADEISNGTTPTAEPKKKDKTRRTRQQRKNIASYIFQCAPRRLQTRNTKEIQTG